MSDFVNRNTDTCSQIIHSLLFEPGQFHINFRRIPLRERGEAQIDHVFSNFHLNLYLATR